METLVTDVAVVGAGPGGVVLAYLLARSGVRTVLLEQHTTLDREFRGFLFQPLVLDLCDQMGLRDKVLQLCQEQIREFHFLANGKRFAIPLGIEPPAAALIIPQPPLLRLFIDQASRYDNFSYHGGMMVTGLHQDGGQLSRIQARSKGGEDLEIQARLVVGADGRFSTIRRLAGIPEQPESSHFDVVWFRGPALPDQTSAAQAAFGPAGLLFYIPMGADGIQFGWLIPKGTYAALRAGGIAEFRRQIATADPRLTAWLTEHLTDFQQCSLLPVATTVAQRWVQDGLMLIGDAAHTASPVGGQGNGLAIQDAVAAHPVIMAALAAGEGVLTGQQLAPFEAARRPDVLAIMRIQRFQGVVLHPTNPHMARVFFSLLPLLRFLPFYRRMQQRTAFGVRPLRVAYRFFRDVPQAEIAAAMNP